MNNVVIRLGQWLRLAATEVRPDIFAINTVPTNANGENVGAQYPLSVSGDSVYCSDVVPDRSITDGWTAVDDAEETVACIPFSDLMTSITNVTADNPKTITFHFQRTVYATNIGLGCDGLDCFSNVKIVLLGSGDTSRSIVDESAIDTKYSSRLYTFNKQLFNAVRFEFYTDDAVTISNITIQKTLGVSVSQVEPTTDSLKVIQYSHAELHGGTHYYLRDYHLVAKAGVLEHLIVTPDTARWAHMTIGLEAISSPIVAELFENPITTADGTLEGSRNRNRNHPDDNTTSVYLNPTVTDPGDLIVSGYFGSGKRVGGGTRDSEEILLKQNTKYLIRVTEQNILATQVNIELDWYEHTNISE